MQIVNAARTHVLELNHIPSLRPSRYLEWKVGVRDVLSTAYNIYIHSRPPSERVIALRGSGTNLGENASLGLVWSRLLPYCVRSMSHMTWAMMKEAMMPTHIVLTRSTWVDGGG